MKTSRRWSEWSWRTGLLGLLFIPGWSHATEPESPLVASSATLAQVHEALQREVYGLGDDREKLLTAASAAEPKAPLPRWYLGQVQGADGSWKPAGAPLNLRDGQLYREYAALRATKSDDATAHKSLADWCERNGLKQQERAHLVRSLALNPNQAELRSRLGLVKVGHQWVERWAIERERVRREATRAAYEQWLPVLTKLAPQFDSPNVEKQQSASEQILAIKDPAALPALHAIFGIRGEKQQLLVLKVCERMSDLQATQLIAFLAAESHWDKVRQEAAQQLSMREPVDFAPLMIGAMFTPVESQVESKVLPNGSVALRRSFVREGAEHYELFVSDARFDAGNCLSAMSMSGTEEQLMRRIDQAKRGARFATYQSELVVEEQNRQTKARNERITAALVIATGVKLPAEPAAWWQWWMDLNELALPSGKNVVARYQRNQVDVISVDGSRLGVSCLNAGTPIWTEQGPVAVERICIGDLVLSRDVETGELAYKPVLLTTVRSKRQLTEFSVGKEKIQATGGHLFWVSGSGWVRTKELQPSQVLHTATSPAKVSDVQPGIVAETYNLVVADFHTYFVGDSRLLSHDNSPRRPTRMIVPGLPAMD
jgi:DnaJ-domain-containing protein 1